VEKCTLTYYLFYKWDMLKKIIKYQITKTWFDVLTKLILEH